MSRITLLLPLFFLAGLVHLSAAVALLVGEPFGKFGSLTPTGHAAVYLSRVCAETPTKLRRCEPGEMGVVISRYHRVAGYDWIAIPVLPYLYAVEKPEDVPASAEAPLIARLRDRYRRRHLQALAPDGPEGETPAGDWVQLAGSAYDRTLYGFAFDSSPEDDDRLIARLNAQPNRERFNLLRRNCADFARSIVNFYCPRALGRSFVADAGISTPKHSAKMLVRYCRRRPQLHLSSFVVPQIPGARPSTRLRGVNESLIRSKKYVVPLVVLEPWIAATAATAYLVSGRFDPSRRSNAVCEPQDLASCMATEAPAVSIRVAAHAPATQPVGAVSLSRGAAFNSTSPAGNER
jgi:hypothetical protein